MKKEFKLLQLLIISIFISVMTIGCSKNDEPDISPDLDPQLVGTWEVKASLKSSYVHVILTFNADGKLNVSADGEISSTTGSKKLTGNGTWTAKDGIVTMKFTDSSDPELIGDEKSIKYEIIADKLYIEYLPLFPFSRI